jgi:hypothetical protein
VSPIGLSKAWISFGLATKGYRFRPAGKPLAPPLSRAPLLPEAHAPGVPPKTARLSYSLSLSVPPEFISQDYRFGFLATIKHTSNCLIGTVFLISFDRERRSRQTIVVLGL